MKVYKSKFYSWWKSNSKIDLGVHLSQYHKDLDVTSRIDTTRLIRERFTKEESLFYYKYNIR